MTTKFTDAFLLNAQESLNAGMSLSSFCKQNPCSSNRLSSALKQRLDFTVPSVDIVNKARADSANICAAYAAGESVLNLSQKYKVSRQTIGSILTGNGVALRDGSKANKARFAKMSPDQLIELTKAARKTRICNLGDHAQQEIRNQAIGVGEIKLSEMLTNAGIENTRQVVVSETYCIDIVVGHIAVEVKFSSKSGFATRGNLGDKEIIERGYTMVYFFINSAYVLDYAAGEIVALFNFIRGQPPLVGQYWVIRCTLDDIATHDQINDIPLIDKPPCFTASISKRDFG